MYKLATYLLTALMYCIAGQTIPLEEHTVVITCQEPGENPTTQLKLGLSPSDNRAQLIYKDQTVTKTINVYPPGGIYSSSVVTIKSLSSGGFNEKNTLMISADMSEVYRVTNYKNFSLTITKTSDGQFAANLLSYKTGTNAFPDRLPENTIELSGLSCTVKGL